MRVFGAAALVAAALAAPAQGAVPRGLAGPTWSGGSYTVAGGEHVTVFVSTSYDDAETLARRWAEFFAGLPHGAELSLVRAFVAPRGEVQELCASSDVVGCYGGQKLVTIGDSSAGEPASSVAAHEYGHHVAANRLNTPWSALDWGTKRWASLMGICSRTVSGTAYPGDEGVNYSLNPGEAFAESYRVLAETNGAALDYIWPVVDPSFRPDARALEAVRDDVLHPWTAVSTAALRGTFERRAHTWTTSIATPLDGDLTVRINVPNDDVNVVSPDGRTVLAKSSWSSSGGKAVTYRICGVRSVKLRVVRGGPAARFTLQISRP